MFELKDSVCSARQKKAELNEDTREADSAIAELEKELCLLLSAGSISKAISKASVPVIEYESVSDSEHVPPKPTTKAVSSVTTVSHQAVSYEAISDSECCSRQNVSGLTPPSIQVEPISDTEESPIPIETEPVSDIEDEPSPSETAKVGTAEVGNTQFPAVETESVTDAESDDALSHANSSSLFLREHDYCKDGSNIEDVSIVGVAFKAAADECKPDHLMSSQHAVPSSPELASDHDVFIVGEVDMEQTLSSAKQKAKKPKPVARNRGVQKTSVKSPCPRSSGGLENALKMVMSKALPCAVSKAIRDHVVSPPSPCTSEDLSPASHVEPLLNTVVTMLTRESLDDITTKASSPIPPPPPVPLPPVVNHVRLDTYFHCCDSHSFSCGEQQPPVYALPCVQDVPLAVEASSISEIALQALHNSFSLAMEGRASEGRASPSFTVQEKKSVILAAVATTTACHSPSGAADTALSAGELAPPDSTPGEGKLVPSRPVKTQQQEKPQPLVKTVKSQQLVKPQQIVKQPPQLVKPQQLVKPVKQQAKSQLTGKQQNSVQKIVESRLQENKLVVMSKHIVSKEELNSQAAPLPDTKPVTDGDLTETCARTSGLRKSKTVPPQANTPAASTASETISVRIMVKKILSVNDFSSALDDIASSHTKEPTTRAREFTPLSFLSDDSMIPSLLPSRPAIPDKVLSEIESSPNLSTSAPPFPTGYQPYSSPLLMFTSYRLNPAFHSINKIPLDSLTYSNKMDPNKVMCKFELTGVCSDPNCTAQHVKDLEMTEEEVVKDLVSYAPTLAGCTSEELTLAVGEEPQMATTVAKKITSYTSKLLKKYVDKVSSKELYRLTVHEANAERVKNKPKKEFVNFEERPWSAHSVVQTSVLPLSKDFQPSIQSAGVELTDMGPDVGHPSICPPPRVDERR